MRMPPFGKLFLRAFAPEACPGRPCSALIYTGVFHFRAFLIDARSAAGPCSIDIPSCTTVELRLCMGRASCAQTGQGTFGGSSTELAYNCSNPCARGGSVSAAPHMCRSCEGLRKTCSTTCSVPHAVGRHQMISRYVVNAKQPRRCSSLATSCRCPCGLLERFKILQA